MEGCSLAPSPELIKPQQSQSNRQLLFAHTQLSIMCVSTSTGTCCHWRIFEFAGLHGQWIHIFLKEHKNQWLINHHQKWTPHQSNSTLLWAPYIHHPDVENSIISRNKVDPECGLIPTWHNPLKRKTAHSYLNKSRWYSLPPNPDLPRNALAPGFVSLLWCRVQNIQSICYGLMKRANFPSTPLRLRMPPPVLELTIIYMKQYHCIRWQCIFIYIKKQRAHVHRKRREVNSMAHHWVYHWLILL